MPDVNIAYERPYVYPYQREIIDCPTRFTVTEAATKIGKTASHIIWLFEQALNCKKDQTVWWVAPSIGQAKMAFDRMKNQLNSICKDASGKVVDEKFFTSNETHRLIS